MATKDLNILGSKVSTTSSKKDIAVVTNYNSYVQKIENICRLQKGEVPSAMNLGSDYYAFIFNPKTNQRLLETNLANYIKAAVYELDNIDVTVAYYDDEKIILNITFSLSNGINQQNAACTIEVSL